MQKIAVDISDKFFSGQHFLSDSTGGGTLINLFLESAIVVSGIILLFLIVFGGIGMIAGAGNNDPQRIEQGKKAVTAAIVGMILILTTYWVLRIIELLLGNNFITG